VAYLLQYIFAYYFKHCRSIFICVILISGRIKKGIFPTEHSIHKTASHSSAFNTCQVAAEIDMTHITSTLQTAFLF